MATPPFHKAYGGVLGFTSNNLSNTEVSISQSKFVGNKANASQVCKRQPTSSS